MKTIYAVSQGSYSDYRVVALFSTEADAKLFMERHTEKWSEWNDLETYQLDSGVPKMRKGYAHYWVRMSKDGSSDTVEPQASSIGAKLPTDFIDHKGTVASQPFFNWHGWAKNQAHALKSANEHRLKLLAKVNP